jgi:nifR3 family TIM-barrel protein
MLRIGHLSFDLPAVQAALSGYSDVPMRRLARLFGAPYTLNEVVLDKLVVQPGKLQREILRLEPDDHPIGGQLMGAQPADFARAAALMAESGYDVVDINFGCPVRKVLGRCRGGFLLSDPATAIEIIRSVRAAVPASVPVTLKMRRGMDDDAESERAFFHIFDAAVESGLAAITVHPRTVRQRYVGPSQWAFLAQVKRYAGAYTILGSGDLYSAADVMRMLNETGVDGVTLARGCIGYPWLFPELRALLAGQPCPPPPDVAEQGRVIRLHLDLVEQSYPPAVAPRVFRKFAIRYAELHPAGVALREQYVRARQAADYDRILAEWYAADRVWPAAPPRSAARIAAGAEE